MGSRDRAWSNSPDERSEQPLRRYLEALRERWWLVLLVAAICTGAAVAYALTASKVYEAHADMLVTPVPDDQTAVLGLGLIRKAADPTRDVTTAARLIDNPEVAARVVRDLGIRARPGSLLDDISVEPIAQSGVLAVTASGASPREAQRLANAFAAAAVAERTEQLHRELDPAIQRMRDRIRQITGTASAAAPDAATQPLYEQLAALESLRSSPDPTLRFETRAFLPDSPVSPRAALAVAAGLLAGLLLGMTGAFALHALDPRRNREQRVATLGLPVLTRVPRLRRSRAARQAFDESFRVLRTMLRFAAPDLASIAVTSTAEREGKTTTSFQLAMATLEAGQTVLLVEADPYRRALHRLIDAGDPGLDAPGLLDYLSGTASLDEIIRPSPVPGLSFVAAGSPSTQSITGLLERARGREFVSDLTGLADVVILDCPPVGPRSDALLIAAMADAVLLVVDLAEARDTDVTEAVRRLHSAHATLAGVVLNRDESRSAAYDYGGLPDGSRTRDPGRQHASSTRR
jgi:succinoglycan biosynthesis transport protein ExoP